MICRLSDDSMMLTESTQVFTIVVAFSAMFAVIVNDIIKSVKLIIMFFICLFIYLFLVADAF